PTHLIVMVNGIIGSPKNWRYAAKQFVKAHPHDILVHCSEANYSALTFHGVDVMGKRLANEVVSIVNSHPSLGKISFVGHSLGGLIARFAIALLYRRDENGDQTTSSVRIAGLVPMNFITFATPHLGSRGHKQVPMFCGWYAVENAASRASTLLGRTGKHLFLRDSRKGKLPLLVKMSNDSNDLKFLSALQSFGKRMAYANVAFDHIVGWSSSSLRRLNELPKKRTLRKNTDYRHVVNEEFSSPSPPSITNTDHVEQVPSETRVFKSRISEMEETMISGLTRLDWHRIDVSFEGTVQSCFAHNTIQVQNRILNSQGTDVIQHMIHHF
ncbi:hypothetical protein M569_10026, partial [Genlisea aurea]